MMVTVKCPFCGHEFELNKAKKGCTGCPFNHFCQKSKCPNCGFDMLVPFRIVSNKE